MEGDFSDHPMPFFFMPEGIAKIGRKINGVKGEQTSQYDSATDIEAKFSMPFHLPTYLPEGYKLATMSAETPGGQNIPLYPLRVKSKLLTRAI